MFKIKLCLITVAIGAAVFSAFANSRQVYCETQQQYYRFGGSYIAVGQYGVDYYCLNTAGNCTYYEVSPGNFAPCRTGAFTLAH